MPPIDAALLVILRKQPLRFRSPPIDRQLVFLERQRPRLVKQPGPVLAWRSKVKSVLPNCVVWLRLQLVLASLLRKQEGPRDVFFEGLVQAIEVAPATSLLKLRYLVLV